jgi:hypothetical protein
MDADVRSMRACGSRWRLVVRPQGRTIVVQRPKQARGVPGTPLVLSWPTVEGSVRRLLQRLVVLLRGWPVGAPLLGNGKAQGDVYS